MLIALMSNLKLSIQIFQGGFAKCFEFKNLSTGERVAGKIIPVSLLDNQIKKNKMARKISLHRKLSHPYVVQVQPKLEPK